jgi:hypothetical protein
VKHYCLVSSVTTVVGLALLGGACVASRPAPSSGVGEGEPVPDGPGVPAAAPEPACTRDAKICPDGSAVGRTGPACEFAACPEGDGDESPAGPRPVPTGQACTKDAKVCPDGSVVGRSGPACAFAPCPGEPGGSAPPGEPPRPGGTCKNLCGNGTCEEVVCMAIGCPCAETKASCPEDCP